MMDRPSKANTVEEVDPSLPGHPQARQILRDGAISAIRQPVASLLVALVAAVVCITVFTTTGQAAATEARVMNSIDSVGTRLIITTDTTGNAYIPANAIDTMGLPPFGGHLVSVIVVALEGCFYVWSKKEVFSGVSSTGGDAGY